MNLADVTVPEKLKFLFFGLKSKCKFYVFYISVFAEDARRPWVWGGAGLFLGLLVVVCDQFIPQKPAVQVSSNNQNHYVTD